MKYISLLILLFGIIGCKVTEKVTSKPVNPLHIQTFHQAVRLKLQGQVDSAITEFNKCILIDPTDDASFYALSGLYMQKNDVQKSAENIIKASEIDPNNIWYTEEIAYMYFEKKDYLNASKAFSKLVKHESRNIEWLYGYAESLAKSGKPNDAIEVYSKLEDQTGKIPELSINKFRLFLSMKQDEKALAEIESCRKVYPKDPQLIAVLVDYYFQKNDQEKAISLLKELVKTDPENGRAHLALADIYRRQNLMDDFFSEVQKALNCDDIKVSDKISIVYEMIDKGGMKIDQKMLDLAIQLTKKHPAESKVYALLGELYYKIENDELALQSFKQSLNLDKNTFAIWNTVIILEYQAGKFEDLYKDSKECLNYFTTMPVVYLLHGISSIKMKSYDEALTSLDTGIELVVNDKSMEAEFIAQKGEAKFGLKQFDAAIENYELAIKKDPVSTLIKNNFAYRLAFWKINLERALELANEVVKTSELPHYVDTKGLVLFQMKNYTEAQKVFERAFELNANDHFIVDHLGDVQSKLGNKDKAVEYWKKAKEMGSTNKNIDKKIESKTYHDPIY